MDYSLNWEEAAAVVVTATGMYVAVLALIRLAGRRLVAAVSAYDLALGLCLGSIMGRAILGYTPSLPAGVLGLATLFVLHTGTRQLLGSPRVDLLLGGGPVLVMKDGQVLSDALRSAQLSEDDLRAALRRAGIGSYADVGVAIVERTGTISILRPGQATADVLTGVDGWR